MCFVSSSEVAVASRKIYTDYIYFFSQNIFVTTETKNAGNNSYMSDRPEENLSVLEYNLTNNEKTQIKIMANYGKITL